MAFCRAALASVRARETFAPVRSSLESSSGSCSRDSQLPSVLSACVRFMNRIFPRERSTVAAGGHRCMWRVGPLGGLHLQRNPTVCMFAQMRGWCQRENIRRPASGAHGTLGSHSPSRRAPSSHTAEIQRRNGFETVRMNRGSPPFTQVKSTPSTAGVRRLC